MTYAPVENFLHSMKDEAPKWFNPITEKVEAIPIFVSGKEEPINKPIGPIGPYKGGEEIKPIDPYKGGATVELLGNIIDDLFNTARGDVNKRDYDKLQDKLNKEYFNSPQINPKGIDPFLPITRLAGVPYTLPMQKLFYKGGDGKVKSMTSPLDFRNNEETWQRHLMRYPLASNPVGDSQPIRPFETNRGIEYMPVPYGPVQNLPRAQTDLEDIMFAGAPRFIQSSPPPNIINKAPHIDSPFMDRWYKERELLRGPQLFPLA